MKLEIANQVLEFANSGILIILCLAIIAIIGKICYNKFLQHRKLTRSLNMAILQVSVTKKSEENDGNRIEIVKENIAVMEQLYASLHNIREDKITQLIYGPFYLSFEIATPIDSKEIFFYIGTPRKFVSLVEKQISSFYQDVVIERISDYNIFVPNGGAAASYMNLNKKFIYPIKTYQKLESDPLLNITNALSKIPLGEGAAVQILIKPAKGWQATSRDAVKKLKKGKDIQGDNFFIEILKEIFSILTSTEKKDGEKEEITPLTQAQENVVTEIETKASKVGFHTNIRIITSAANNERAENLLREVENSYSQFNAPDVNGLKVIETLWGKSGFLNQTFFNFIFRNFEDNKKITLNTEELASLFHMPISNTSTPQINWLKSKQAPPPINLVDDGLSLGYNIHRGDKVDVKIGREDRRRHLYIIGQTGTGKSSFISRMVKEDIAHGEGICVIDPHGDLIQEALEAIPKERAEDVILFDPSHLERPIGLNLLEYDPNYPEQKTFVINEMIKIFDKLYDLSKTGGPMFEQYMRNAMLLIMDDPDSGSTLIEISKVLSDADFRKYKLSKCKNNIVKDFWQKEAEKAGGEAALANMVPYITSKLTTFISNDTMRPIIGQQKSSINFRNLMDEQKILLVNLSKGRIGEMNAYLLGLVLVGKILISSLSRTDIPQEQRKDFYLYIDEFQNFTTDSISTIFSEARKYRLCLTVAHQFLGQLPEEIQQSVFGNVGTLCSFRVGAEDAEILTKQFSPVFNEQDLININNFNACMKLMINGKTGDSFNIATYPPTHGNLELAENIKQLSFLKFGKNKKIVEQEINNRTRFLF